MAFISEDKNLEKNRYDKIAKSLFESNIANQICEGSKLINIALSSPYIYYESVLKKII